MAEHTATVQWNLTDGEFLKGRFSRKHSWSFDGGAVIPASPSPAVVPAPLSDPSAVDPEEAYVASLASCHMLTFLFLAYKKGFEVTAYEDTAVGRMGKDEDGIPWVETVTLQPRIEYGSRRPSPEEEQGLHQAAHRNCYIANSVKTEVRVGS